MKACILAGGEGRRLRPLTTHLPKPMVPLLGKPLLYRIVAQLRSHGIREMALTLMYLPDVIRDALGDGSDWDATFFYSVEQQPMGTAGGVRACLDFLKGEDCLIISGDAVCDFDFSEALRFHREKQSDVTILLNRQDNPTEYGLVQTDPEGRIQRFLEKPAWSEVFTNVVNTGIYLLSPSVLEQIPPNQPFDFSKALFPMLLKNGRRLYGYEPDGYWCDIGDTAAYLRCTMDALNGRFRLQREATRPGFPPTVWVHPEAVIQPGAQLGPNVWVGAGAYVGENSMVADSIVEGTLAANCEAEGTIVCAGSCVDNGSVLCRGSVIGSGAKLGDHCHIGSGVRIDSELRIPPSAVVRTTQKADGAQPVRFEEDAVSGAFGTGLSPEVVSAIGSACAELPQVRTAALGCCGGADAQSLLQSIAGGMTAAGLHVFVHDVRFAAGAAAMPELLGVPISVFVDSDEELSIRIFDASGRPIPLAWQRKLEGSVARGEYRRVPSISAGRIRTVSGGTELFAASVAQPMEGRLTQVAVHGRHPAAAALTAALQISGIQPPAQPALSYEGLTFSVSRDGFHLTVSDGDCRLNCREAEALVLLTAMLEQPGITLALPASAPQAYERMAEKNGAAVIRLESGDERAQTLYASQRLTHNAIAGAVALTAFLNTSGTSLRALKPLLPAFGTHTMELDCTCEKSSLMRMLAETMHPEPSQGLLFRRTNGTVRVTPSATRSSLKILVESFSEEAAKEIALDFAAQTENLRNRRTENGENRAEALQIRKNMV